MTNISWTDESWNPVTGCSPVSEGCAHCYAKTMTHRFGGDFSKVTLHPDRLAIPLHWRKPRMVFVPSMGDLFHEDVPDTFIGDVFSVMVRAKQHTFQVLTKRPERMRDYLGRFLWPDDSRFPVAANVWLGVSVENQARADERIPILLDTPAAVRFVSAEPLLGPLNLWRPLKIYGHRGLPCCTERDGWHRLDELGDRNPPLLDWVIVGGESGGPPGRRLVERCDHRFDFAGVATAEMDPCGMCGLDTHRRTGGSWRRTLGWRPKPEALGWVSDIRDQCQAAGVPFFFKQWGPRAGQGTEVDGREHREMPQ